MAIRLVLGSDNRGKFSFTADERGKVDDEISFVLRRPLRSYGIHPCEEMWMEGDRTVD